MRRGGKERKEGSGRKREWKAMGREDGGRREEGDEVRWEREDMEGERREKWGR